MQIDKKTFDKLLKEAETELVVDTHTAIKAEIKRALKQADKAEDNAKKMRETLFENINLQLLNTNTSGYISVPTL